MPGPFPIFSPAGDAGILVTFGETIDPLVNRRVHALAERISDFEFRISNFPGAADAAAPREEEDAAEAATTREGAEPVLYSPLSVSKAAAARDGAGPVNPKHLHLAHTCPGRKCRGVQVSEIRNPKFLSVPGYAALLVTYDPLAMDYAAALEVVRREAEQAALALLPEPRRVEVPVLYGGEHGPDLEDVARHCRLTPEEVVQIHTSADCPVYFIGFTPGFPYLGGMDPRLAAPRLPTPRSRVPAGSVGIAGPQTGIYSIDSPGGWRIIGWTPLRLFDPAASPPALLRPGDVVRFMRL